MYQDFYAHALLCPARSVSVVTRRKLLIFINAKCFPAKNTLSAALIYQAVMVTTYIIATAALHV